MADPLSGTFRRPFPEQVAAFRARLGDLVPTRVWTDLENQMHDRAFMVAGAMKADLLADLAGAVDRVIAEGIGLEEFKKDFLGIAQRHGWSGWTGQGTKAGEHWRARVIYRTNMRTTYAAGRMAQLRAEGFRYWIYRHGGSLHPREAHLGWDGLILPADHPFWATHAPPNGWGCSCYILGANSMAQARRLGGDPTKVLPEDWSAPDPRTGAPDGIDKGWDYAPGASVSDLVSALSRRLHALPEAPSIDLIRDWLQGGAFRDWAKSPQGFWPVARLQADEQAFLGVDRPVVFLSPETLAKQVTRHGEIGLDEYRLIQGILSAPGERLRQDARNVAYVVNDPARQGYVLILKAVARANEVFVTSFYRLSKDGGEAAREIRRLRRGRAG